jgi:hypothetical protein
MRRAAFTALFVGFILLRSITAPPSCTARRPGERICQILLTLLVPYSVSTISSVATRHEMNTARMRAGTAETNFFGEIDPA